MLGVHRRSGVGNVFYGDGTRDGFFFGVGVGDTELQFGLGLCSAVKLLVYCNICIVEQNIGSGGVGVAFDGELPVAGNTQEASDLRFGVGQ